MAVHWNSPSPEGLPGGCRWGGTLQGGGGGGGGVCTDCLLQCHFNSKKY